VCVHIRTGGSYTVHRRVAEGGWIGGYGKKKKYI
jgi:hypothetical protein